MRKGKSLQTYWGWVFFMGLLLLVIGVIAIAAPFVTTLASIVFFGWLLVIGGIAEIGFAITHRNSDYFLMHSLVGLLTIVVGFLMVFNPTITAMTFTLLLAVFFLGVGIFRIFSSVAVRFTNWGWAFIGGILSVILGALILIHWPSSALWVIGLFIGIDLLFTGWSFIIASLVLKNVKRVK